MRNELQPSGVLMGAETLIHLNICCHSRSGVKFSELWLCFESANLKAVFPLSAILSGQRNASSVHPNRCGDINISAGDTEKHSQSPTGSYRDIIDLYPMLPSNRGFSNGTGKSQRQRDLFG